MKFPEASQIEEVVFAILLVAFIVVGEVDAARIMGVMDQQTAETMTRYSE